MTDLVVTPIAGLPEIAAGDDIGALVRGAIDLQPGDVVVVAQKVVSKAEGRLLDLATVEPRAEAVAIASEGEDPRYVEVVLRESVRIVRRRGSLLICETRHGLVCASAGVDRSNAPQRDLVVLLPLDPDASARALRARLGELRGVRPAVIVSDSFGRAWRIGQTDVAIGAAGLRPLDDWIGRFDASGRELRATAIAVADSVAAAADLARQKDSREPAVLVRGLLSVVVEDDGPGAAALRRERDMDLFR